MGYLGKQTGKGIQGEDGPIGPQGIQGIQGIKGDDGAVMSVAGRAGAVVLAKEDVGLSNVDNTSDVNKPVSTATQNALNNLSASGMTLAQSQATALCF